MGKKRGTREAQIRNNECLFHIQNRIEMLATNLFKWENLPNNIPEFFIEKKLYNDGRVCFFNDKKYGLICTNCNPSSQMGLYGEPTGYQLYNVNGYTQNVLAEEVVILRNNINCIPTYNLVNYYLEKIYEIDRTIEINVKHQRSSKIILCDEYQKLSVENILKDVEMHVPYITGTKGFEGIETKTLDLTSTYIADKLYELKEKYYNEMLELLGINSANTNKKERLITDEVNANNDIIGISSYIFLHYREKACEEINKKWGTNMSVERRVFENGNIHSGVGNNTKE